MELISIGVHIMNACHGSTSTPQMGFDFLLTKPVEAFINKPGHHSHKELHAQVPNGITVGDALSQMVVEDRALGLGMTNWRVLIESAISTGHTELYAGEGDSQGLRKPGLRFGPIARMPEIGPEYVKRFLLGKQLNKASQKLDPVKSGRVAAAVGVKVECVLGGSAITFNFYDARKLAGTVQISLADLPMTAGAAVADAEIQTDFLAQKIRLVVPDLGSPMILAAGAVQSFGAALKVLEK
jgi:hypothetical protein